MIKNFIFDFGGVLYQIDPKRTVEAFKKVSGDPEFLLKIKDLFRKHIAPLEKGEISHDEFRERTRHEYKLNVDDETFDKYWNITLIKMYDHSIQEVLKFKKLGRVILLSNTNPVHYNKFKDECSELFSLFEKLYFSFNLGMIKPQAEIFEYTLKDMDFKPGETVFIDDSESNIETASSLGIKTVHYKNKEQLSDLIHTVKEYAQK